ncbi:MAG: DDE-type integrase/transposase/recombinase [Candidatus Aegiribacteria sp.]|nr:DDE-type integrase/transposase/recombinase [Candidatus Aegiribacteria sp.]
MLRLQHSFAYLTVIMDWFSRYVLSWELSLSLESSFYVRALETAMEYSKPEIFNTDQGSQYTSDAHADESLQPDRANFTLSSPELSFQKQLRFFS